MLNLKEMTDEEADMTYNHFKKLVALLEHHDLYATIGRLLDHYPPYAERLAQEKQR